MGIAVVRKKMGVLGGLRPPNTPIKSPQFPAIPHEP